MSIMQARQYVINEVYKKKKGHAFILRFQYILCKHSIESYTSSRCTPKKILLM